MNVATAAGRVASAVPRPARRSGPPAYPRTSKKCGWVVWVTEPCWPGTAGDRTRPPSARVVHEQSGLAECGVRRGLRRVHAVRDADATIGAAGQVQARDRGDA